MGLTHASSLNCREKANTSQSNSSKGSALAPQIQVGSSRLASPAVMDSLGGGGCPSPTRDPAFLHRFPSCVPHPANGALPWQTHRHSVSGLAHASKLELHMRLRQCWGRYTRMIEATLIFGRHARIHWNRSGTFHFRVGAEHHSGTRCRSAAHSVGAMGAGEA